MANDTLVRGCGANGIGSSRGSTLLPVNPFWAPHYHFGMLLGVDDFESEQAYHRGKQRLHNAWLHGEGVVWGLAVDLPEVDGSPGTLRGEIRVQPGLALDAAGRELYLEGAACVGVAAWYEANRNEPELQAVVTIAGDGTVTFPAHVVACFRACTARPVPSISEPCNGAGSDVAYSRVQETVELRLRPGPATQTRYPLQPGPIPEPLAPYHRLRLLFALEPPREGEDGNPVPADQEVLDERADILARPAEEQPAAYLDALRRLAALDGMELRPAFLPEEGGTTLFPAPDDSCVVLAEVREITLARGTDGALVFQGAVVDNTVRPSHVATSTIQELLCGPFFGARAAASPDEEEPPEDEEPDEPPPPEDDDPAEEEIPGEDEVPAGGEVPGSGDLDGPINDNPGERERTVPETFNGGAPRIDPRSVEVDGETVTMTATSRVSRASVSDEAFSVSAFDRRDGWHVLRVREASVDRGGTRIRLELANAPGGNLVRIIARGTGPTPLIGPDGVPLAGSADGGPAGTRHDGRDFVLMVKRSET